MKNAIYLGGVVFGVISGLAIQTYRIHKLKKYLESMSNKVECEDSISLAREVGVPEDQILHSEDDLMHFLCD